MNNVVFIGSIPALWEAFYVDGQFFRNDFTVTRFPGFTVAIAFRPHLDRDTAPVLIARFVNAD
jgi:protein tyrosine phosphatase (PTP) superfamily phosphohydrolase (DUF442 family)